MQPTTSLHTIPLRAKTAHRWTTRSLLIATLFCSAFCGHLSAATGQDSPASHSGGRQSSLAKVDGAGITRSLYAIQSVRYPGTPEEAARAYLQDHGSLLRVQSTPSELRTEEIQTVPGGTHVRFQQMVQGLPVFRAGVVVSLNNQNQVGMVINNFRPDIMPPALVPNFDGGRALQLARGALGGTGRTVGKPPQAELLVYRDSTGVSHLAYRVTMVTEEPAGDWEILVDALGGQELRREDRFVRHSEGETRANGSGYVYLNSPLSAARQTYGTAGFVDGDDQDSDSLSAYRSLVQLDSLLYDQGVYSLSGPYCTIADIESPVDSPYVSATPDGFRFTRSQPGFEAVMTFYHISAAYKRLLDLGFSIPTLARIQADPHGYQGRDNSHYSPSGNWISFGTGGVDDAEDADVIWHEYGHAIQYNIDPHWGGGECGALGEGYGDYWAASHSQSLGQWEPQDPQSHWLFVWDGHNPFWSGRITNDARKYPFDNLSVHSAGQIWASALLGIQDDLGRDMTDRLVVKSLFYLTSDVTAVDAAQAMLQADRDLYGGQHAPTLLYWLSTIKNFLPSDDSLVVLVVHDDAKSGLDGMAPVNASPIGTSGGRSWTSRNVLSAVQVPEGYALQMTSFADLDTAVLTRYSAIVLLGGLNGAPFENAAARSAIAGYVLQGGKVLVEGGQVGYYYRRNADQGEKDKTFRKLVLGSDLFISDAPAASLIIPGEVQKSLAGGGPFFNAPHLLPTPIEFVASTGPEMRDAVTPAITGRGTIVLGGWSSEPMGNAIIAQSDSSGFIRTMYLPFSLSSVKDSGVAVHLVENAMTYLLFHQATAAEFAEDRATEPDRFELLQNYPNPFNPSTTITFAIPEASTVRVEVYSVLGQLVKTLVDGPLFSSTHTVRWDGRSGSGLPVSSGTYIVRFEARPASGSASDPVVQTRRMMLLK
jgi:zinc metalloprotease ZmpB